jgi:hypothetical protein
LVQSSIETPHIVIQYSHCSIWLQKKQQKLQNNNNNRAEDIDTAMYSQRLIAGASANQHVNDHTHQAQHHHGSQDDAQNSGEQLH